MRYTEVKLNDIVNSDGGINISIWTQGCPHHCKECFNPNTWSFNTGKIYNEELIEYIFSNIDKHNIKRNLAILGGEALCCQNICGVIDLCKKFKERYPNKKILIWTGYTYEDLNTEQQCVLPYIDILVDGKFEIDKKDISLKMRGSSNQRIIDVKESLKQNKIIKIK